IEDLSRVFGVVHGPLELHAEQPRRAVFETDRGDVSLGLGATGEPRRRRLVTQRSHAATLPVIVWPSRRYTRGLTVARVENLTDQGLPVRTRARERQRTGG